MSQYLNEEGARVVLSLMLEKIDSMKHLKYEVVSSEDENATIQTVVTNPVANTVYLFKAGTATTFKMYICEVTSDNAGGTLNNWLPVGEGSVDLSQYYSKEELKPLTEEQIKEIFNDVVNGSGATEAAAEVTE